MNITVTDPAGAVIPGATLELKAIATNDLRTGTSQESGIYRFVGLNVGRYSLTVTKEGFSRAVINPVVVEATRVTDVQVQLKLGTTSTTVEVTTTAAPVLETSSNMIGTTIDVAQLETLPLGGRDITQLARLSAGYNGTWNGMPSVAQGNNIDGVISSSSRMKFTGNSQPSISPRLENIEEMTVQTDQLDVDQGFGQAAMQINFITKAGTNSYHGRLYEDFRNAALNANSWSNNGRGIRRAPFILNDFGGSIGGPILKDKLFFFASFGMSKQPGTITASAPVLTTEAQNGNFTYVGTDGATPHGECPEPGEGLQFVVAEYDQSDRRQGADGHQRLACGWGAHSLKRSHHQQPQLAGTLPGDELLPIGPSRLQCHRQPALPRHLQPAATASAHFRSPPIPGRLLRRTRRPATRPISPLIRWASIGPRLPTVVNQFRAGFLYNPVYNPWYQGDPLWTSGAGTVNWGLARSGQTYTLPISNYYPTITISDSVAWQRGSHQLKFGFSGWQEHDKYWNAPAGITGYNLGLANGDPALGAFTASVLPASNSSQLAEAEQLYALLVGRISSVSGQFGLDPKTKQYRQEPGSNYNLNELLRSWGLFAQDAWHLTPTLTVNLGLRWDFTGDNYDLTGAYHNALPKDVWGPSGIGNLFRPGQLGGEMNPTIVARPHAYNGWKVSPAAAGGHRLEAEFQGWPAGKSGGGSHGNPHGIFAAALHRTSAVLLESGHQLWLAVLPAVLSECECQRSGRKLPSRLAGARATPCRRSDTPPAPPIEEVSPLAQYTFTVAHESGQRGQRDESEYPPALHAIVEFRNPA